MTDYDKIPKPPKRCENCINGRIHVTSYGEEWRDVYRCTLDDKLKDYRVMCEYWRKLTNQS